MGAETHADDKIQSQGRTDNAARPPNDAPDNAGAERYPSVNKDDSIDPGAANPQPRQGAGDGGPRPSDPTLDQSAAKR